MNAKSAAEFAKHLYVTGNAEAFEAIVRGYCREIIQDNLHQEVSSYAYGHCFTFTISPADATWTVNLSRSKHDERTKGDCLAHANRETLRRLEYAAAPKLALSYEPM